MLVNLAQMSDSRRELEGALALFEQLGDVRGQGRTLEILTMNLQLSGDLTGASDALGRGLPILRANGDRRTEVTALASESTILTWRRGLGSMLAIELVSDPEEKTPAPELANAVIDEALVRGLLLLKAGVYGNCIRVLCPLTIADGELDEALAVWEDALAAILG